MSNQRVLSDTEHLAGELANLALLERNALRERWKACYGFCRGGRNMKPRHVLAFAALTMLLLVAPQAMAISNPSLTGSVSGTELCPQSICGSAIFAGSFKGKVNGKSTSGSFWTGVNYESPLPSGTSHDTTTITGGTWLIWTTRGAFAGSVAYGGTIAANGNNTFAVSAVLDLTEGGTGSVDFDGTLNHNVFPPTIVGTISQ